MPRQKANGLPVKAPVEFTWERKEIFLAHLEKTGFQNVSARVAGVTAETVLNHRKSDAEFDRRYRESHQLFVEEVLEAAAIRRGVEGVNEPVIGGKDRDIVVTQVKKYSDGLLQMVLKAKSSPYRATTQAEGDPGNPSAGGAAGGFGGGLLIVPFPPPTKEEWEALYGEAAKGMTGSPEVEA